MSVRSIKTPVLSILGMRLAYFLANIHPETPDELTIVSDSERKHF